METQIKKFPAKPGVYYFKDGKGKVIYIGKAGDLKQRVSSYFIKAHDDRIARLVSEIKKADYKVTPSALEALVLEANEIRRLRPKYNIRERDDKSFLYLVFTKEKFPKPKLIRGHELKKEDAKKFRTVFGPYLSAGSLRAALRILRKIFPYSDCEEGQSRPCFYHNIGLCPGVCAGKADAKDYKKTIKRLEKIFAGKKLSVLKELQKEMKKRSADADFESAAKLRNKIFALKHIRDTALLTDFSVIAVKYPSSIMGEGGVRGQTAINIFGRIEGYDISNISGVQAVGSMVVFEEGEANKKEYKRFKIKEVKGINDIAMLKEVLSRRFAHDSWPLPDLLVVDGGRAQVNAALDAEGDRKLRIPVVGIAKGFKRKQDRLVYDKENLELQRIEKNYKDILLRVRDEAHRFAIFYHRKRMRRR